MICMSPCQALQICIMDSGTPGASCESKKPIPSRVTSAEPVGVQISLQPGSGSRVRGSGAVQQGHGTSCMAFTRPTARLVHVCGVAQMLVGQKRVVSLRKVHLPTTGTGRCGWLQRRFSAPPPPLYTFRRPRWDRRSSAAPTDACSAVFLLLPPPMVTCAPALQ
jgi:hypothetical protein